MQRFFRLLSILVFLGTFGLSLSSPSPAHAACLQTYSVQRGNNLFRIGLRFGLSWKRLQVINGLSNPNHIRVGQRLCVRLG